MTTAIMRGVGWMSSQLRGPASASEVRDFILQHQRTFGSKQQVHIYYDLKTDEYRVYAEGEWSYQPLTPGYQETGFGLDVVTVTTAHMGRHEHGFRRIECPPVEQDLADREADEWTARLEEELDTYLASLE